MEHSCETKYDVNFDWSNIYIHQICKKTDKKLAEFNYKLICNILCTRSHISKWNPNINSNCAHCGQRQTVKHLLYECIRVQSVWKLIGTILNMNIRYKHIIIGSRVASEYIEARNLTVSYIAYSIYKFWILAENKKLNFNQQCLLKFIKTDLFKRTCYVKDDEFHRICDHPLENI